MNRGHRYLLVVATMVLSSTSIAQPDGGTGDAGAERKTIPPLVDEVELPAFDAEPFPAEKSKAPTIAEWTAAPRVRISRTSGVISCIPKRVREWIKIRCEERTAGLRLLAGSTDGIALWVPDGIPDDLSTAGTFSEIIFPVRPGDARVFEVIALEFGEWEGWGTSSEYLVEEEWPVGGTPQIVMLRR